MKEDSSEYFAGVDWGMKTHAVCIVDGRGERVESFRAPHSPEGLRMLQERVTRYQPLHGVAIETPRHIVVHLLLAAGVKVYAINPLVSKRWRETWTASGAKDDERDALVLATGLLHHQVRLRPLVPETGDTRKLQLLCEGECQLIREQTRTIQQLETTLREYYPAALEFFTDWTSRTAWDFVVQFPTPAKLARASKQKLFGFLKCRHIGLSPIWQERVVSRTSATDWPCDEVTIEAKSLLAVSLAKQLCALAPQLKACRKQIEALFPESEDHALFESLPGAGPKLDQVPVAGVRGRRVRALLALAREGRRRGHGSGRHRAALWRVLHLPPDRNEGRHTCGAGRPMISGEANQE